MDRWSRKPGELHKTALLADGEIVALLLDSKGLANRDLFDAAYASAKELSTARTKAFSLLVTTTIVAILVKFEVISAFSTIGLSLAKDAFKPMALTGYSLAGLQFAYFNSRFRFFELWFQTNFEKSEPSKRSELLLRYPLVFDIAKMYPVVLGLPKFMHTKRSPLWKLPAIIIVLLTLIIFTILAFSLWITLSIDVWNDAFPNRLVAGSVIFGSVLTTVIAAMFPFSGNAKKIYEHYGLVLTLADLERRDPVRHKFYINKIAKVREMLLKDKEQQ